MSNKKPKLEHYWAWNGRTANPPTFEVNWRLVAANGELLCQCTQGFRDKADSLRNARDVLYVLMYGRTRPNFAEPIPLGVRVVGPGKKPS